MNILIIEDEWPAYRRLSKLISETMPEARIAGHAEGVQDALRWLASHPLPELVFLDINLGDGTGFDLLQQARLSCPVIFTTAYDQYAIEAFRANGLDYLMKPIRRAELEQSVRRLDMLRTYFSGLQQPLARPEYKSRFLIRFGGHIKTLEVTDIAFCYSENKATFARCFDGRSYPMDHNLDALEGLLDPARFFRINRQYLICLQAIADMKAYTRGRVMLQLQPGVPEAQVVSSERAAGFKQWLAGE